MLSKGKLSIDSTNVSYVVNSYLDQIKTIPASQFDLMAIERPKNHDGTIFITKCLVLDVNGNPIEELQYGEPISIGLEIISKTKIKNISVIVGIDTIDKKRITTVVSDEKGKNFIIYPNKKLRLIVNFPELILYPGEYLITLAIRSRNISLDTLMYVSKFNVTKLAYKDYKPYNGTWGIINTRAQWNEIDKLTKPKSQ